MREKLINGCVLSAVATFLFWAFAEPQETRAFNNYDEAAAPQEDSKDSELLSKSRLEEVIAAQEKATEMLLSHAARLDEIESALQRPVVEESVAFAVRLYTADDSWRCTPCKSQGEKLRTTRPSFDYETIKGPREGKPPGRGVYPTWEIVKPDGETAVLHGARSVSALEKWVDGHKGTVGSIK